MVNQNLWVSRLALSVLPRPSHDSDACQTLNVRDASEPQKNLEAIMRSFLDSKQQNWNMISNLQESFFFFFYSIIKISTNFQ